MAVVDELAGVVVVGVRVMFLLEWQALKSITDTAKQSIDFIVSKIFKSE